MSFFVIAWEKYSSWRKRRVLSPSEAEVLQSQTENNGYLNVDSGGDTALAKQEEQKIMNKVGNFASRSWIMVIATVCCKHLRIFLAEVKKGTMNAGWYYSRNNAIQRVFIILGNLQNRQIMQQSCDENEHQFMFNQVFVDCLQESLKVIAEEKNLTDCLEQKICRLKTDKQYLERENESFRTNMQSLRKSKVSETCTCQEKDLKILQLKKKIEELKRENEVLKKSSEKITQEMAQKTAKSGCFESSNDEYSNTRIAERIQKLYSNDWAKLSRLLRRSLPKEIDEIARLSLLSTVVKQIYDECSKLADQPCSCLLLEEAAGYSEPDLETPVQRRSFYQQEDVRMKVKEKVLETVLLQEEALNLQSAENKDNANGKLKDFFGKVTDCCWQVVAISNPPMMLNFSVVDKLFENVENFWTQYSTKIPVQDMSKLEGTIRLVVWPSVELKPERKCYNKGDAVVVKKGRDSGLDSVGKLENAPEAVGVQNLDGLDSTVKLENSAKALEEQNSNVMDSICDIQNPLEAVEMPNSYGVHSIRDLEKFAEADKMKNSHRTESTGELESSGEAVVMQHSYERYSM